MPEKPDLVALLGSRICHDLISPIGAISNGVELLLMDGGTMGPEIALISESVANANARIRFFRVAYGGGGINQRIGQPEVVSILSDLTRGGRLTIDWRGPVDLLRREVKLAFLLIQCLESAMAFGGRITVEYRDGRWILSGTASKLKIDADLWRDLSDALETPDITAAQVHFALVQEELARQNRQLKSDIGPTEITLSF
ncbi:MAG: histidine phosphotransferase [Rhodoferax sp.]|nr:histidine phosphotransferase [Pseudorhodobacter sp.]